MRQGGFGLFVFALSRNVGDKIIYRVTVHFLLSQALYVSALKLQNLLYYMRGSLCIYGPANLKSKSAPERISVLRSCDTHNAFNAAAEKAGTNIYIWVIGLWSLYKSWRPSRDKWPKTTFCGGYSLSFEVRSQCRLR